MMLILLLRLLTLLRTLCVAVVVYLLLKCANVVLFEVCVDVASALCCFHGDVVYYVTSVVVCCSCD